MPATTLLLIRHAKSSWDDLRIKDFDRTLNDRGRRDAPVMAGRLLKKQILPGKIISSSARRAMETTAYFKQILKLSPDAVQTIPELYLAEPIVYKSVIENYNGPETTLAIIGHNPGITQFANMLTSVRIDDMPTTGIFAVQSSAPDWKSFFEGEITFLFFDYPKSGINF